MIEYKQKHSELMERSDFMQAFEVASAKYELRAKQRTALGDHPNYQKAMWLAYMGTISHVSEYWREFERLVPDVLDMKEKNNG